VLKSSHIIQTLRSKQVEREARRSVYQKRGKYTGKWSLPTKIHESKKLHVVLFSTEMQVLRYWKKGEK